MKQIYTKLLEEMWMDLAIQSTEIVPTYLFLSMIAIKTIDKDLFNLREMGRLMEVFF